MSSDYDDDTVSSDAVIERVNGVLKVVGYRPMVDGKKLSYQAPSKDIALLIGLGYKYDGANSQFAKMACRMLKLEY